MQPCCGYIFVEEESTALIEEAHESKSECAEAVTFLKAILGLHATDVDRGVPLVERGLRGGTERWFLLLNLTNMLLMSKREWLVGSTLLRGTGAKKKT